MFEQVIGDGANVFFIIVAIVFGFVNALALLDNRKVTKDQEEKGRGN